MRLLWIATLGLALASGTSTADEFIKIMKVKGQKAIVKLPNSNFQKGDEVKIASGLFTSGSEMNGRRKYRADFDISLGQDTVESIPDGGDSSETSTLGLDVDITFGFNGGVFEYGPIVNLEYSNAEAESSTTTTTNFGLGGFFEYNFAENTKGVEMVPYVGAQILYNSNSATTEPESG
ncbi:MAG: hypothetical protein AAF203_10815, partial [Pseudomonadota bacterium]